MGIVGDRSAGLLNLLLVDQNAAGKDERLRPFPRGDEAAAGDQFIQTLFQNFSNWENVTRRTTSTVTDYIYPIKRFQKNVHCAMKHSPGCKVYNFNYLRDLVVIL